MNVTTLEHCRAYLAHSAAAQLNFEQAKTQMRELLAGGPASGAPDADGYRYLYHWMNDTWGHTRVKEAIREGVGLECDRIEAKWREMALKKTSLADVLRKIMGTPACGLDGAVDAFAKAVVEAVG